MQQTMQWGMGPIMPAYMALHGRPHPDAWTMQEQMQHATTASAGWALAASQSKYEPVIVEPAQVLQLITVGLCLRA